MYLFKIINTNHADIYIVSDDIENAIKRFNSENYKYSIKSVEKLYHVLIDNASIK